MAEAQENEHVLISDSFDERDKTKACTVNLRHESYDVYIGRAGRGQDGYFGNPFKLKAQEDRGTMIERYRTYFKKRIMADAKFRNRIQELHGKRLGCFCKPRTCHGDVIVEYLEDESIDVSISEAEL